MLSQPLWSVKLGTPTAQLPRIRCQTIQTSRTLSSFDMACSLSGRLWKYQKCFSFGSPKLILLAFWRRQPHYGNLSGTQLATSGTHFGIGTQHPWISLRQCHTMSGSSSLISSKELPGYSHSFYRLITWLKCALYGSEGAFTVFLILTRGYLHKYSLSHYPDTVDKDCLCHTGLVFACIVHKASA